MWSGRAVTIIHCIADTTFVFRMLSVRGVLPIFVIRRSCRALSDDFWNATATLKVKTTDTNTNDSQGSSNQSDVIKNTDPIGIFTKERLANASEPAPLPFKTQREISRNKAKRYNRLADSEDYGDAAPVQCQFTKELQKRRLGTKPKLLQYPIDNQDIVWEESVVPFTEHISLHSYLPLFPERVREFMTTIISALQANPDLTVSKKKEIIQGYLSYFSYHSDKLHDISDETINLD